jgi:stress-induced morphogen
VKLEIEEHALAQAHKVARQIRAGRCQRLKTDLVAVRFSAKQRYQRHRIGCGIEVKRNNY